MSCLSHPGVDLILCAVSRQEYNQEANRAYNELMAAADPGAGATPPALQLVLDWYDRYEREEATGAVRSSRSISARMKAAQSEFVTLVRIDCTRLPSC